jgi:hypothetical protein
MPSALIDEYGDQSRLASTASLQHSPRTVERSVTIQNSIDCRIVRTNPRTSSFKGPSSDTHRWLLRDFEISRQLLHRRTCVCNTPLYEAVSSDSKGESK